MAKKKKQNQSKAKNIVEKNISPQPKGEQFPPYFTNHKLLYLKLFLISVLLYIVTVGHDFTQDDAIVLTANDYTKEGIKGIPKILKYDTFKGFFKVEGKDNLVEGGRYRPLTLIMFAIGYELWGDNPMPYHLMSILWYGLTVVLLFIVFLKLLQSRNNTGYMYFVAFVTALLFAIHPIHTEVVANIKGRDEILTLFFSLAAMWFSLRNEGEEESISNELLAGILFFLALMAKEMAVVFIPIVAISFFVFKRKTIAESLSKTVPYIISFAAFFAIRSYVLETFTKEKAPPPTELMNNAFLKYADRTDNVLQIVDMETGEKFATIFYTLGLYIKLLIFPHPLTHDYYPRAIPIMQFSDPQVGLSILIYIALIGFGIWGVLKRNHIAYGVAFFLTSLFLVSNIPLSIGVNMAERFAFIPSIGFCFIAAVLLYQLCKKMNNGKKITEYIQFQPAMVILIIVFAAASYKTITRAMVWKDNYTLFTTDWSKYPNSAKMRNSMGGINSDNSQLEGTKGTPREIEMLNKSLEHSTAAIQIHPLYKGPYLIRGNTHFYLKQYDKAIADYQMVLKLDPDNVDAVNNLKIVQEAQKNDGYLQIEQEAISASQKGDHDTAIAKFSQLTQMLPTEAKYKFFLAMAYLEKGDPQTALIHAEQAKAINKDPNNTARIEDGITRIKSVIQGGQ